MSLDEYLKSITEQEVHDTDEGCPDLPPIPNRRLHIDGDFVAYMASFDETISFKLMCDNLAVMLDKLKNRAQAESIVIHLTPKGSTKGDRDLDAVFQPYQENRKGKEKPARLEQIRLFMANHYEAIMHYDQEADDGLTQAYYADPENTVIATKDKDLNMVPGWHIDWDTGELQEYTLDGTLYLNEKGGLKGTGIMWFWAQMLMGDTADNIKGLPMLTTHWSNVIKPTATVTKAMETLRKEGITDKQRDNALKKIRDRKPIKVGPKVAYDILRKVSNSSHRDLFILVRRMYNEYTEVFKPKCCITGELLRKDQLFFATGRLLWMRRTKDRFDFDNFIQELIDEKIEALRNTNSEAGTSGEAEV